VTVSVVRLEVPDKARSEYDKACGDFKKKKLADAEAHIRSAIEKYANYGAAWVMLGLVLSAQQTRRKSLRRLFARGDSRSDLFTPYIRLAELDVRSGEWDEILKVTKMAQGLNPAGDAYPYLQCIAG
jgi:hypothetical protein